MLKIDPSKKYIQEVRMVKVSQPGFIERVIKIVTKSKWNHAMLLCKYMDENGKLIHYFTGLDLCGAEFFTPENIPWGYQVDESRSYLAHGIVGLGVHEYRYRLLTNFDYLIYKIPWLRRFIKTQNKKTNCVGWIRRVLGLPLEFEYKAPGNIF